MLSHVGTARQRADHAVPDGPHAAVVAVALLALVLAIAIRASAPSAQAVRALVGQPAPMLTLPPLSGNSIGGRPITLADERGHPLLLVFTYTLCSHCLSVTRAALGAQSRVPDLRVLLVDSPAETPSVIAAYLARVPASGHATVLLDNAGAAARAYHADMNPTTVLIDSSGIIRAVWVGETGEAAIISAARRVVNG